MGLTCLYCGKPLRKGSTKYCNRQCRAEHTRAMTKKETRICPICNKEYIVPWFSVKKTCSKECGNVLAGQKRKGRKWKEESIQKLKKSKKLAKQNDPQRYQQIIQQNSERMKKNNPMHCTKNVKKMLNTRRINGTLHVWAGERGGNGKFTPAQVLLATSLGWEMEVAIPTKSKSPYPTCYKVDVGNRDLKLAILS